MERVSVQERWGVLASGAILPSSLYLPSFLFPFQDILVNNAGLALGANKVTDNNVNDIQRMLTVNVA